MGCPHGPRALQAALVHFARWFRSSECSSLSSSVRENNRGAEGITAHRES